MSGSTEDKGPANTAWLEATQTAVQPRSSAVDMANGSGGDNDDVDNGGSDDDSEVWQEVTVPAMPMSVDASDDAIEISLPQTRNGQQETGHRKGKRKSGITGAQRQARQLVHKAHLLALLAASLHRNRWCNDTMLQACILSIVPSDLLAMQDALGRQSGWLATFLKQLVAWWDGRFEVTAAGSPLHQGSERLSASAPVGETQDMNGAHLPVEASRRCVDSAQAIWEQLRLASSDTRAPVSADAYALGFTALCRVLGMDTRLVASLHPIPLSFGRADHDAVRELPAIEYWNEVFCANDNQWIPVHPADRVVSDPHRPATAVVRQRSLSYAIAWEDNHAVKDVTLRYSASWSAVTSKLRLPPGEDGEQWWRLTLWFYSKSIKTSRDVKEDKVLAHQSTNEAMPTTFAGFANHPLYALERHCKRDQIIYPKDKQHVLGVFKNEPIYPSSHIQTLRTAEAWKRFGRQVRPGQDPMMERVEKRKRGPDQQTPQRNTADDGGDDFVVDESSVTGARTVQLFGEWQTELIQPPKLIEGRIPRNAFGNVEIFHPRMIPEGTVHIAVRNVGAVARKLGIDHAPAVTGFQFAGGRMVPVVEGIIVAKDIQELILEAADQETRAKYIAQQQRKESAVMARWKKLTIGLLTRARLFKEYMRDE